MKKVLVIAALVMFSLASAQKGTILVAGNIGFSSEKIDDTKNNDFNFSPKVGYQFHDNWTVGISGRIATGKRETEVPVFLGTVTAEDKHTDISVGPFVRYSKTISETFGFFTDLDAGYQSVDNENTSALGTVTTAKGNGFYAALTPAIFINVKKNFGLNVSIGGLAYDNISYDGGGDMNSFRLNFGQTVNVGISKNF